jgi:hypothetical protein
VALGPALPLPLGTGGADPDLERSGSVPLPVT